MDIYYHYINFPLGYIFLAKKKEGLFISKFLNEKKLPKEYISEFIDLKSCKLKHIPELFSEEIKLFNAYFNHNKVDFSPIKIDLSIGSLWERRVWIETAKIPYGEVQTYKSIAEKLNSKGFRAVGKALSKNPLLIIIPCHRVIKTDKALGGFSAGIEL
ncbi:methylated-DNA--[protein]-cysteine S-methyltransferase, partial [Candidatus Aminicenantes bacterium AC-335-A11]|nr:methylated-DNA--[protein]-cysteine S-methyltransferase [Candidatus Aminicenantes bacterium AC-335-A11]